MIMEINDRVWYTGTTQYLYNKGFLDNEMTLLLHTYGQIADMQGDSLLVSFEAFRREGYPIVRVWLHKSLFKLANLSDEYIEESENEI